MIIGASWLFGEIFLLFPRFPDLPSATYVTKLDFLFDTDIDSEITKKKFDPQTLMAATLAVCGVGFLELAGSQQFVIGYIRLEEIMQDSPKDALPVTAAGIALCWGKDGKALAWYTGTPWYTFAFHT
ncbi:unnamed protein product [Durusdinium trenchii]|uniref:Uncharacterized protein n=1 Tax=Durusdinium trenchii TaxID=1381693 RepID=A0ABP0QG93_9DINO